MASSNWFSATLIRRIGSRVMERTGDMRSVSGQLSDGMNYRTDFMH